MTLRAMEVFLAVVDTGSMRIDYRGVSVAYDCTYQGFSQAGAALIPEETENEAHVKLRIEIGDESH